MVGLEDSADPHDCPTRGPVSKMALKEPPMIELTQPQHEALSSSTGPVAVIDRATSTEYVLLRKDVYERLRGLLDEDDARLMAPLLMDLDPEDWEDISAYPEKP
jgi:hypothetical protein